MSAPDPRFSESVRIEARVKLSACGNARLSGPRCSAVCFASYSSHVSAVAIPFRVLARCHTIGRRDRKVSGRIDGRGGVSPLIMRTSRQKTMTMKSADEGDDLCFAPIRENCVK